MITRYGCNTVESARLRNFCDQLELGFMLVEVNRIHCACTRNASNTADYLWTEREVAGGDDKDVMLDLSYSNDGLRSTDEYGDVLRDACVGVELGKAGTGNNR